MPSSPPNCRTWDSGSGAGQRFHVLERPIEGLVTRHTADQRRRERHEPSATTTRHRGDGSRPSGRTKAIATVGANRSGHPCVAQFATTRAPGAPIPGVRRVGVDHSAEHENEPIGQQQPADDVVGTPVREHPSDQHGRQDDDDEGDVLDRAAGSRSPRISSARTTGTQPMITIATAPASTWRGLMPP